MLSKKSFQLYPFLLFAVVGLVLSSCKKDPDPEDPEEKFDRSGMLSNLANNLIIPAYNDFKNQSADLQSATSAFTASPSQTTLDALRTAWQSALLKWQYASIYEFGPAEQVLFRDNTNLYPIDTLQINTNISNGTWDLNVISNLDAKGLQAFDFFLFGSGSTDAAIIDRFVNAPDAPVRKQYLNDLANDIATLAAYTYNGWITTGGNYVATFTDNTSTDAGSPLSLIANAFNKHFEKYVRSGKISIPAGALTFSQVPEPTKTEAYYKNDISLLMALAGVDAISKCYRGEGTSGDGLGFDDYLNFVDATFGSGSLDDAIENQIGVVNTSISGLTEPLSDQLVNNQAAVLDTHAKMNQLVALFKNDMMSAMGVIVTYTDTDGD